MRILLANIVLMLVTATSGCQGCSRDSAGPTPVASASATTAAPRATASPADVRAAEEAVISYYAAIAGGDCPTLMKFIDPPMSAEDCKGAVKEWAEHGGTFDRLVSSVPDGREASVVLVTVRFASGKGARDQIIRVSNRTGAWKLQP